MKRNGSLGILAIVLLVVIVVTLLLTPTAWAASKFKTLYKFGDSTEGRYPHAGLIFDSAGNLYGTTFRGGFYGGGTVFRLTPHKSGSWTKSVLYSFNQYDNTDGAWPYARLTFDPDGNLYGTTFLNGAYYHGTVFKLTPNGDGRWTHSVLHSFNGTDGDRPYGGVIFDSAGNLYGTTSVDSNVFKLTPNEDGTWTETVLHSFNQEDGGGAYSDLIFDPAGNLYGTTRFGGGGFGNCLNGSTCGVVFKLTPNDDGSWTETVLYSFCSLTDCSDGQSPYANVILDPAGNLYGTTTEGGTYGVGTVFELAPNEDGTWTESVLHSFNGRDGSTPYAGVILDSAGNLYGTTSAGGAYGFGTIFKLNYRVAGGWKEAVLHSFKNHPGAAPYAGVIFDGHGNLYGTTVGDYEAVPKTRGSIFEIVP